ncbi:hypothetical protein IWQ61_005972 [Dispira simplex]|nr:hypothetical protein IWQ61_005972 [Dispira simplex]
MSENPAEDDLRYKTITLYRHYLRAIKRLQVSDPVFVHSRVRKEFQILVQVEHRPAKREALLQEGERILKDNLGGLC